MIDIYGIFFKDQIVYIGQTGKGIKSRFSDHKFCCKSRPRALSKGHQVNVRLVG